jgi:hypothetical protein
MGKPATLAALAAILWTLGALAQDTAVTAFVDVQVVPMDREHVFAHQTVLLGPAPAPPRVLSEVEARQRVELLAAAEKLDQKLQTVESRLVSRALRNSDDKYFVEADGVYLDPIWLNAEVGTGGGDVAGGADFAPTETELESLQVLESEMARVAADLSEIRQRVLPAFNQALQQANLTPLLAAADGRARRGGSRAVRAA